MVVKVFRVTDKNFELWWQWVILQTFSKPHLTFSTLTGGEWRSADLLHSGCHAWAQPFQTTNKGPKGSVWWGGHLELQWKWIQATIIGWLAFYQKLMYIIWSVLFLHHKHPKQWGRWWIDVISVVLQMSQLSVLTPMWQWYIILYSTSIKIKINTQPNANKTLSNVASAVQSKFIYPERVMIIWQVAKRCANCVWIVKWLIKSDPIIMYWW